MEQIAATNEATECCSRNVKIFCGVVFISAFVGTAITLSIVLRTTPPLPNNGVLGLPGYKFLSTKALTKFTELSKFLDNTTTCGNTTATDVNLTQFFSSSMHNQIEFITDLSINYLNALMQNSDLGYISSSSLSCGNDVYWVITENNNIIQANVCQKLLDMSSNSNSSAPLTSFISLLANTLILKNKPYLPSVHSNTGTNLDNYCNFSEPIKLLSNLSVDDNLVGSCIFLLMDC